MLYPYTLIVPWQNSVFKSLEISLEGKVICQVEKEGIVVDPLEVTEVCHTGCSIKKKLQIRKWMSSVCCSHLKMALSGLYLSCNEKCLCGLPGTRFPNCWKTSLPIRLLSHQQRSSWCSVWSCLQLACTYEHIPTYRSQDERMQSHSRQTAFWTLQRNGKNLNALERRGVGHGSKITMSISQPLPEFVKRWNQYSWNL